jgi:Integral membrane protein
VQITDDPPVFAAELTPYRSLGRKGFHVLLILTGGICLIYGVFFLVTGAWPIGLFLGLDFLALYIAFKLSYRSGRAREEVTVTRTKLSIRKFSPAGKVVEHRFNPFWARFRVNRHDEFGITSMYVTGEGRWTDIGSFLNPDDRESFAKAFRGALATVTQRL